MKVVHVITSTNLGGAQIMLQRYLEALGVEAEDHFVISLMPLGPISKGIAATGAEVTSLDLAQGRISVAAVMQLRQRLRALDPDVVVGWMYHGAMAAYAGLVGRGRSRPALIWSIHHSLQDPRRESRSTRVILKAMAAVSGGIDRIVYCSKASQVQHEAVGFSNRRTMMIPNAIDTNVFKPDPDARARLGKLCGIPANRIIIGNVARGHPMKDHGAMMRAVGTLVEKGYDAQAVILGEGHEEGAALAVAKEMGMLDRLSLLGARSDVAELVPGFDIFLLSSAWGEAFPLAVAEAMAAEVPCVATNVGDCAILVADTGKIVPPGDPMEQATAVASLIDMGAPARAELGRKARLHVKELCDSQQYVKQHQAVFDEALGRRRHGRDRPKALA